MLKIALVGKPNVGKSSIFNRLISQKKAIVDDSPGVTRDRNYGEGIWLNHPFTVIDTGGLTKTISDFKKDIEKQVSYAIEEADVILFVISGKEGINNDDYLVLKTLKQHKGKQIFTVVNKSESEKIKEDKQFYQISLNKLYFISAEHGIGIGDLLDDLIKIKPSQIKESEKPYPFCIIGRTNVGKSTLLNSIVGEERSIASPIPHTTRDMIDTPFTYHNEKYLIIDTAGIRRRGKIQDSIERYAIVRTEHAISKSSLILLTIDCSQEFNEQDEVIGGLAFKANLPTIICVNKWDLLKDKSDINRNKIIDDIRTRFKYLSWAPIVFISAKENKNIQKIFETIALIRKELQIKISTSMLNDVISRALITNPPSNYKGGIIDISYGTQIKSSIPSFVLFTNDPKYLHFSYMRYIENKIRSSFNIKNVPILVYYKDKNARIRAEDNSGNKTKRVVRSVNRKTKKYEN